MSDTSLPLAGKKEESSVSAAQKGQKEKSGDSSEGKEGDTLHGNSNGTSSNHLAEHNEEAKGGGTMAMNQNVEITASNSLIFSSPAASTDGLEEDQPTAESDLLRPNRQIWVVTTAALPWRTGTAVNPLLRALALCKDHRVTLVIPWLEKREQRHKLYGSKIEFNSQQEQEAWIRDYCRTRCNAEEEEPKLKIMFWSGSYNQAFGSIFPIVDICALIPSDEADVAILEEPEHLNWFRVVPPAIAVAKEKEDNPDLDVMGWAHKFKHVVGILHTNYSAYMKQYGVGGTAFVTARALNALSALVIKSYCHRVVRLSPTLPSLVDPTLEVTSNVHGVRAEFLSANQKKKATTGEDPSPVYFVGKIIWAKGFDKVLEVQERYRTLTGDYFRMDIYGHGDDVKAIERAFLGRRGNTSSSDGKDGAKAASVEAVMNNPGSIRDQAAAVSAATKSPQEDAAVTRIATAASDQEESHSGSLDSCDAMRVQAPPAVDVLGQLTEKVVQSGAETAEASMKLVESVFGRGIGVLSGASSRPTSPSTIPTAAGDNKDSGSDTGSDSSNGEPAEAPASPKPKSPPRTATFDFLPARSRFKWRKHPIPARFLGVKDHADITDPRQSVFLNMSTTEVLCTTSAEALAMGKFVILPKHPSNEFFFDFPNCLVYETLDGCVEQLQYALENKPCPLSDDHARSLSWEGATERLYKAAEISKAEASERAQRGLKKEQEKAAKHHVDLARKSHFVSDLFSGKVLKKLSSVSSSSGQSEHPTHAASAASSLPQPP